MNKVYLDNSSSTKVLSSVQDTFNVIVNDYYANSSALHTAGNLNNKLFKEARNQIASLCAVKAQEIFFTSGASEAINTVLKGLTFYNIKRSIHIVTTTLEHPSVIETLNYLQTKFDVEVTFISPVDGEITVEMIESAVKSNTMLVSLVHVQSETGIILPVEEVAKKLNSHNTLVHVDACQSFGKINLDFKLFDMVSVSFHKLHGFKGSGFLYKKSNVKLDPLIHGGNQQELRSGTIPLELCVSGAKATRIAFEELNDNSAKVRKLWNELYDYFSTCSDVVVNSRNDGSPYIFNMSILNVHTAAFARMMWEKGFSFSTKTACSADDSYSTVIYDLTNDMNLAKNSIRISLSKFSEKADVEAFIAAFELVIDDVRGNNCG